MKKRKSFWQTLGLALILAVVFFVGSCANSDVSDDGEIDVNTVPVATIVDKINETYPLAGADVLTEDLYKPVYQLTADMVEEAKIIVPLMNVKSNELAGMLAKPGQVNAVKEALEARQQTVCQTFQQYLPDQYEIAQKGEILVRGNYVFLLMLEDNRGAIEIIDSYLK